MTKITEVLTQNLIDSIEAKQKLLNNDKQISIFEKSVEIVIKSYKSGGRIYIAGNGGSAADAQHLAAEMLVRLRPMNNREGVAAISLAQDTSTITACGNDFGYDVLFERTLRSLGKKDDCLIGITTSGNSKNVILAMQIVYNFK